MNNILKSLFVAVLMVVFACAEALAQDFTAFEGKGLREGEGGAKKTVDGVDFWSDGSPPFKFKIIGVITDRRHKTGLIGKMRMSSLEPDVAQVAKEHGGDGVILVAAEAEGVGAIGMAQANSLGSNSTTFGFGGSAAVQKQNTKYYVVKYFREAEVTKPTPTVEAPTSPGADPSQRPGGPAIEEPGQAKPSQGLGAGG